LGDFKLFVQLNVAKPVFAGTEQYRPHSDGMWQNRRQTVEWLIGHQKNSVFKLLSNVHLEYNKIVIDQYRIDRVEYLSEWHICHRTVFNINFHNDMVIRVILSPWRRQFGHLGALKLVGH
jgi:hypothetical protein